ncbi:MAG: Rpn family recombination-promoting nuclease/putative transposase [Oscillospiraceae bacterium]|nr:Rpn family recombination-promoting nuclease/putative transposase [Oscillospiraceae bacterium]
MNIEIQVENEGDFPERSLFHWARQYSLALPEGEDYSKLPKTIIIGIVHFKLLKCKEYHSEYQALEVSRHTQLSDRFNVHIFELPKVPKEIRTDRGLELWLALFKAKTEEEIDKIEKTGVAAMKEAIRAYRQVSASSEYQEMERLRSKAGHDEAQALKNAETRGEKRERKKWESVVADKEALIAELRARLGDSE